MQSNKFFSLDQIIDREILTVSPETPVVEVISLMQEWGNSCNFAERRASSEADATSPINNSCVLVVEHSKLRGIFTERDLVKLVAASSNLENVSVCAVMSQNMVVLTATGAEDMFTALNMLRQHRIRHLPVVDDRHNLLGLITVKNLRQKLQPIDLMKWRTVSEVMETEVIYAAPDDSVRYTAKLMADRKISCVAIAETQLEKESKLPLVYPIGIITERDIVQFQNLNLDLEQPARNLMSTPLFLVSPQDALWSVHQQMQQRRVRRLLVGGVRGELRGIITQTSLLQLFDPTEMYGAIELLQRQVCQLEIEKTHLLENRNAELKDEVKERTSELIITNQILQREIKERQKAKIKFSIQAKQQKAVADLGQYALAEKNVGSLMERAVNLVARILNVEYCKVLELLPDGKTLLLKAGVGWQDGLVGTARLGIEKDAQAGYTLRHSEPIIVDDLRSETRFSGPSLLIDHQVISGMSVIIRGLSRPFGILGVHTTRHRTFNQDDVNFIQAIANILAQAIERQQAEASLKESQERYTLAVEGSSNAIWDWNIIANEVFFAPRWREILGYTDEEFPNTFEAWSGRLYPEDRDRVLAAIENHLENRVPYNIEYRLQTKSQEYCWVQARGQAIWDKNGRAVRMAGSISDISDRKYREQILRDIASGISVKIGTNFLSSLVEYLSKTLKVDYAYVGKLTGLEKDRIKTLAVYGKGKTMGNFEYHLAGTPCQNVVKQELCVYPAVVQQLFPDSRLLGEMKAQSFAGMPIFNGEGKAIGLIAIIDSKSFNDISLIKEVLKIFATRATSELERQQAESILKQSEQKFMAIFNQSVQFIGLLEPNGKIIEANQTSLDFVGLTPADVVGKPFWETPWWSMSVEIQELLKQAIDRAARGEFVRFEVEYPGTENRVITVDFSLTPIKDDTGQVVMLIPEGRNISDRKKAEAKIREQAALLDVATDAIMVRGLDNKILFWNRGAELLYGWPKEDALNRNADELLQRESSTELSTIQQVVKNQGEWQGELSQVTQAGKNIVVESRWTLVRDEARNPQSFLVVNTDITEQKQLEIQFLRTQRLESLGTLAGGIAHDLNNILAPILGFAKLLPLRIPNLDKQTLDFFKIMETNAQRGAALVKQILTFARGLEGDRGIVQIRHLIAEIGQIIQETFPKAIEIVISAPKNLWTVNGDVNQLHQVLLNLAVNARDAMPDGGKLTIKAENFTVDSDYARLHLDASEGSYLLITVSDTGIGIPPAIVDRIFEPFFTTKEIGQSTGLGLSTVLGIVKSHGGFVDVASDIRQNSRGTQIKVFLPASETAEPATEETEAISQGNGELILVVDDELSILEVTKATLETFNYSVLTANDGIDAIAMYAQNFNAIEVVIMDIMMPSMGGITAIRTLKKINPEVKIIAISGLVSNRELIAELDTSISAFIAKPFNNEDLLKTIHEIVSS